MGAEGRIIPCAQKRLPKCSSGRTRYIAARSQCVSTQNGNSAFANSFPSFLTHGFSLLHRLRGLRAGAAH